MYKDNQEDRNKTVDFMKEHGLYNPMLSAPVMQYSHEVYHHAIESKQLTIEELGEQFYQSLRRDIPSLPSNMEKLDGIAEHVFKARFEDYKQCAIDCGILKQ